MAKAKTRVEEGVEETAKDVVTVVWAGNTREYTKEVHGSRYVELARTFAEKVGGEVV